VIGRALISRAAAAVTGIRDAEPNRSPTVDESTTPAWLWELDEHQGADEVSFLLTAALDDVLKARLTASPPQFELATAPESRNTCGSRGRGVNSDRERRAECRKTRP
jgi:hypothetical protein